VLRHLDALVGRFRDTIKEDDLLVVLGDPGRQEQPSATGMLLVWGGRVVPGRYSRTVGRLDMTPTILALAGLPMARDLPGSPVLDFLKVGDVSTRLAASIESYGERPEALPGPTADPFDSEVLDRLRSLGYIQ